MNTGTARGNIGRTVPSIVIDTIAQRDFIVELQQETIGFTFDREESLHGSSDDTVATEDGQCTIAASSFFIVESEDPLIQLGLRYTEIGCYGSTVSGRNDQRSKVSFSIIEQVA